jgi:hypothetical protein
MYIMIRRMRYLVMLAILLSLPATWPIAVAQPLSVQVSGIDFSALPRVTFKACIQRDGEILRGLSGANMTLLENGTPRAVSVRCPDAAELNSVILVLDNSGSIFGALPKLIEASKQLVDNLGDDDEAAVITFGRDVRIAQGFTKDKALLKAALDGMVASGGTALFDASHMACMELSSRPGNRHAVILTDGEDNLSTYSDDDVVALANLIGAKLHTIAFDIAPEYRDLMERMAIRTGGAHFFVSRPGDLPGVYTTIADIITEPCCIVEYETEDCVDTLRTLLFSVTDAGETAMTQEQAVSPARPEQHVVWIDVPDELTPLATDRGFILISPVPAPDIDLTLSFVLQYDQHLVDVPLLPFTLATLTQNQVVKMERIAPGETRFTLDRITPALNTTLLVGFPIKALVADSSRRVGFSIRDIQIAGCPTTFQTATDSTLICQCFRALDVRLDPSLIIEATESFSIPVHIGGGIEPGLTLTADLTIQLPPDLSLTGIGNGDLTDDGVIQWRLDGDLLHVSLRLVQPRDSSGTLLYLHFRSGDVRVARKHNLRLLYTELWQRCCPLDGELPALTILQDGQCEVLLRRVDPGIEVTAAPNPLPAGSNASVLLRVFERDDGALIRLDLMDMHGKSLKRVYDGPVGDGEMRLLLETSGLPAGRYTLLLRGEGIVRSFPVVVLR